MSKEAVHKAVGPYEKYTEVLVEGVGTVGVPAGQVCKFVADDDGNIVLEYSDAPKKAAPKAAKK